MSAPKRGQAVARWFLLEALAHLHAEGWRVQPVALEDKSKYAEADSDRRIIVIYGHRRARRLQSSMLHEVLHVVFPHTAEKDIAGGERILYALLRPEDRTVLQLLATGVVIADAVHEVFTPSPSEQAKRRPRRKRCRLRSTRPPSSRG